MYSATASACCTHALYFLYENGLFRRAIYPTYFTHDFLISLVAEETVKALGLRSHPVRLYDHSKEGLVMLIVTDKLYLRNWYLHCHRLHKIVTKFQSIHCQGADPEMF